MGIDIAQLRQWVGRTEQVSDLITAVPVQALAATLDLDNGPSLLDKPLRPCWHWLYFLPLHRQSLIGADGHPMRGGFLPPVPLPRRMWAGSQLSFEAPLRVGQAVSRTSRIGDVRLKEGRTGPLVFVQVHHEIRTGVQVCIRETHGIVYRGMPASDEVPAAGKPASNDVHWSRDITPDDVLLFRYSALTFNGHRIHYDRRYATGVEGYPGLVVHGPLIATLLLDLLARAMPATQVKGFAFKAMKPIFDTAPFQVRGRFDGDHTVHLWAVTPDGDTAMEATAHIA